MKASLYGSGSSPRGRTASKPISINPRRPFPSSTHESSIAQSCPAPRAPIIGSLPAPSNMGEMPPLSLPPPSPEAFSLDPIYHRNASAQFASSCPAQLAHFPSTLTNKAQPQRVQGSLTKSSLDSNDAPISGSLTGLSILSQGNPLGKNAESGSLGKSNLASSIEERHIEEEEVPTGRLNRSFSNSSIDDGGVFALDGMDGMDNTGQDGLDKKLETLELDDDAGGMFDFES